MKTRLLLIGAIFGLLNLTAQAAEEGMKMQIPDTAAGILKQVQAHKDVLATTIQQKKLSEVHQVAFMIRDLVNALPEKSKDLPADKLTRVQASAKQVAKLAADLDATGDANDQAGTEANFKKLEGVLKLIEAQYPATSHDMKNMPM